MQRPDTSLPYSAALDGLRGVAIALVLLFHGAGRLLSGGYLGVSTFFTLSGFLITSLLLLEHERRGRIDLVRFWTRRLRRLMPAALLGIALAAAFVLHAGTPSQSAHFRWDGVAALVYGANFRAMSGGASYWQMFSRPSPLQHYWSLSIEEQFYLVYPLLLLGIARLAGATRRVLRVVLALLAVASTALMVVLALSGAHNARLYFGTDTRAAEFLVGALLATFLAHHGELRPWRGHGSAVVTLACATFVIVAVAAAGEDAPFFYRGGFTLYALATAGLLNAALTPGVLGALLAARPLVLLGRISYGVYVYHWPVVLYLDTGRTGLSGVALLLLQAGVTIALASASWLLVERPIRTTTGVLGVRAGTLLPGALAATVALVLVAGRPRSVAWTRLMNSSPMPAVGAKVPGGPTRILVLGDSLAFNLGYGIAMWANGTDGRVVVWNAAQYGCGLVQQPDDPWAAHETDACYYWPSFWEEKIDRFEPDVVVIGSGLWDLRPQPVGAPDARWPGDPIFDRQLLDVYRRAVDIASSRGARVVWINTPCVGPEAYDSPLGRSGAMQPELIAYLDQKLLPALAASRPGVAVFDLFTRLCPDGRFVRSLDGNRRTRFDDVHLEPSAARDAGQALIATTLPDILHLGGEAGGRGTRRLSPAAAR
ncbi:acyltransferase [Candidatus Binatia bacterium]|nr:acyltransferase [Candidatus Binatia bacterium]